METRLNSLIYPIHGFIRSEFDGIDKVPVGGTHSGQIVKVGKSDWRIEIKKECSERTDNMDYLNVYLSCRSRLDSLSSIKVFFNFQLISWEKQGKNRVWNDSSVTEYTNEDRSWGTSNFLKWEELLNGGYVKDGKIVVECAFRIDSEVGIPRRSIDFTEERPNTKDIEMICGVEDVMKSKIIEESIDVSKIDEEGISTEIYFINGIPFKFELSKWEIYNNLLVFLYLNSDDKSEWWRCEAHADVYFLNQITKDPIRIEFTIHSFEKGVRAIDLARFNLDELIDPKNGYVKDGKIVIRSFVQITRQSGFDKKTGQGYVQPMKKMADAVLKVGSKRFHVSKKILSLHSSYFSDLFTKEKEKKEFEMTDLDEDTFDKFLELVHNQDLAVKGFIPSVIPIYLTITQDEIENVLKLAKKWGAPEVIERCDAVLKRMELSDTMKMLELVDKYNLPELRRRFLLKVRDEEILKSVVSNPRFKTLSVNLKVPILEWPLVPEELRTKEKEETDYQFKTDFKKKSEFSDVEITVEGYKYHASKQILANASVFFMKRFYGPLSSDESQMKIFQVSPLQFETLLTHIYHPTRPVTCASLDCLLSLSKQFSVHRLMDKCEEYLILNNTLPLIQKLEYAGKYELPLLLSACLNLIEKEKSAQEILKHPNVGALSPFVQIALHKGQVTKF